MNPWRNIRSQRFWWRSKVLNDPLKCSESYSSVSILNNVVFVYFVLSFLFSMSPFQTPFGPYSKVSGDCHLSVYRQQSKVVVDLTLLYTLYNKWSLWTISMSRVPKMTPDQCIHGRWMVHGFKIWGSFFRPKVVFGVQSMVLAEKSHSPREDNSKFIQGVSSSQPLN